MTVPSLIWLRPARRSGGSTSAIPWACRSSVACVLWTSMPSMCTGPAVSSRTRFAIRNASTTPWQYPRGVILTTSKALATSLRGRRPQSDRTLADPREKVVLRKGRPGLASNQLVVLGAERQPVDLVGHGREPRVGIVLANVSGEGLALAIDEIADVDPRRDQLVRGPFDAHVRVHVPARFFRHLLDERLHHRAGNRRVVQLLRSPRFARAQKGVERRDGDLVGLDVVRVAVYPVLRIRNHD